MAVVLTRKQGIATFPKTFISLLDTPATYAGSTNEYLRSTGSALEFTAISGAGTTDHSALNNLDYENSGHTGFASTVHIHDDRYYIEAEVDTISGALSTEIDSDIITFSGTINHNTLVNYSIDQHRTINDSGLSATDLWSAQKIHSKIPLVGIPGTLRSWGSNLHGQLGLEDMAHRSSPVQVGSLTTWDKMAAGDYHILAIKTDGTLWSWGWNDYGQLGLKDITYRSSPVQVGSLTTWDKVGGGYRHTIATKTDGTLWSWGYNNYGQLGLGDEIHRSSPVQVGSLTTWDKVASGSGYILAIKTDGTLWSWGYNLYGGLGLEDTANRSSPVQVGSLTTWDKVGGGYRHTVAVKTDGTLWSWGGNTYGQLGLEDIAHRSSPVQVGSLTTWDKVGGGYRHTIAIQTDGTLWLWGFNTYGQLGLGNAGAGTDRSSPVQVGSLTTWDKVSDGYDHTLAIKTDGTLWSWGRNPYGQLGLGDQINRSSPVQVGSLTIWDKVAGGGNHTLAVVKKIDHAALDNLDYASSGHTGFASTVDLTTTSGDMQSQIDDKSDIGHLHDDRYYTETEVDALWATWSGTIDHNTINNHLVDEHRIIDDSGLGATDLWSAQKIDQKITSAKTDDTLWSWGWNSYGPLGLGDRTNRSSPVQVGSLTTWDKVACAGVYTIATKTDGTLWSWGDNDYSQLGLGDITKRSSPVQVGSLTTWDKIASGYYHALAIKTDGTLWSWGRNHRGQLGLEDIIDRSSPVQVGSLTTWDKVACGSSHTVAIKTDGTLWSWGRNDYGRLGLGDEIYRSSPVQVGSLTTWDKVAGGYYNTLAIKTDGTLWSWGYNTWGQLGLEDIAHRSSPVQVGTLTTWDKVLCGIYHTLATKTDGTLWSWGINDFGQLGLEDIAHRSSPVQVGSLTTWDKVGDGDYYMLAIKTDGTLWSCGRNLYGQLGLEDIIDRSSPVQVGSLTTWDTIAGGIYHTVAIIKTADHAALDNLDYASSGHTGFASTVHIHDDRYYTETEVDTISGTLQTQIDGKSDIGHTHDGVGGWIIKNSDYTASAGDRLMLDSSAGSFIVTLPFEPSLGDSVGFLDLGSCGTNNVTVTVSGGDGGCEEYITPSGNAVDFSPSGGYTAPTASGADFTFCINGGNGGAGDKIMGLEEDLIIDVDNSAFDLIYSTAVWGWRIK